MIGLQLDLSAGESSGIGGVISNFEGQTVIVRSIIQAERGFYDGRQRIVGAEFMANEGRYPLMIIAAEREVGGSLMIELNGSATLAAKLHDGTALLSQAPLSQTNRAAFFSQLYARSRGSVGGALMLGELLGDDPAKQAQPFWWCQPAPGPAWQDIGVRMQDHR